MYKKIFSFSSNDNKVKLTAEFSITTKDELILAIKKMENFTSEDDFDLKESSDQKIRSSQFIYELTLDDVLGLIKGCNRTKYILDEIVNKRFADLGSAKKINDIYPGFARSSGLWNAHNMPYITKIDHTGHETTIPDYNEINKRLADFTKQYYPIKFLGVPITDLTFGHIQKDIEQKMDERLPDGRYDGYNRSATFSSIKRFLVIALCRCLDFSEIDKCFSGKATSLPCQYGYDINDIGNFGEDTIYYLANKVYKGPYYLQEDMLVGKGLKVKPFGVK